MYQREQTFSDTINKKGGGTQSAGKKEYRNTFHPFVLLVLTSPPSDFFIQKFLLSLSYERTDKHFKNRDPIS